MLIQLFEAFTFVWLGYAALGAVETLLDFFILQFYDIYLHDEDSWWPDDDPDPDDGEPIPEELETGAPFLCFMESSAD